MLFFLLFLVFSPFAAGTTGVGSWAERKEWASNNLNPFFSSVLVLQSSLKNNERKTLPHALLPRRGTPRSPLAKTRPSFSQAIPCKHLCLYLRRGQRERETYVNNQGKVNYPRWLRSCLWCKWSKAFVIILTAWIWTRSLCACVPACVHGAGWRRRWSELGKHLGGLCHGVINTGDVLRSRKVIYALLWFAFYFRLSVALFLFSLLVALLLFSFVYLLLCFCFLWFACCFVLFSLIYSLTCLLFTFIYLCFFSSFYIYSLVFFFLFVYFYYLSHLFTYCFILLLLLLIFLLSFTFIHLLLHFAMYDSSRTPKAGQKSIEIIR